MTSSSDVFLVSSSTALGMAEDLVLVLNTIIRNLPEPELRRVHNALERSVRIADDILCNIAISATFDVLSLSDVSTIPGGDASVTGSASSSSPARNASTATSNTHAPPPSPAIATIRDDKVTSLNNGEPVIATQSAVVQNDAVVPVPAHVPAPAPATPADNAHGMIISSRPRVGRPNYTYHPAFIRPGIPGPYSRPPLAPSSSDAGSYYVVTKGLYVGIFTSWNECSPWVIRVSESAFCKVRQWTEAMNLYNDSLQSDSCEVLS